MSSADPSKQLLDYSIRHRINLTRYGSQVVKDVLSLLNDADREILALILKRGEDDTFTAARLKKLLAEIREMTQESYVQAHNELKTAMLDFAQAEAVAAEAMLSTQVPVSFNIVQPTAEQLAAIVSKQPVTVGEGKKLLLEEIFESLAAGKEEDIRGAIRLGMVEGEGIPQIVRRIRGTRAGQFKDGILEISRRHAEAIIRTVINHTSNQAIQKTFEGNGDLVKGWKFLATLDGRTTITCASLSGTEWPVGKGPIPPRHVRCLPGDTLVSSSSRITAVSKRWYDGDMVIIKTASGRVLSTTPNHPILTPGGWVAAGLLNVRGHVISNSGSEWGRCIDGDNENMPARIKDIAEAFLNRSEVLSMPVPLSSEDFHGDGVGSKVAIIGANRELWVSVDSPFGKHIPELNFVSRNNLASRLCPVEKFNPGALKPSDCIMGSVREPLAFFRRGASHASKLLFTTISRLNAVFSKQFSQVGRGAAAKFFRNTSNPNSSIKQGDSGGQIDNRIRIPIEPSADNIVGEFASDGLAVDTILARQILNGEAGKVFADKIIDIHIESFSGHVYNLQTESNWYIAEGIITHNCRSFQVPILKSWKELGFDMEELPSSERASKDGPVRADITFDEWLRGQDKDVQKDILGATRQKLFEEGVKIDRFTDRAGVVCDLKELEARNKAVFRKVFG